MPDKEGTLQRTIDTIPEIVKPKFDMTRSSFTLLVPVVVSTKTADDHPHYFSCFFL